MSAKRQIAGGEPVISNRDEGQFGNSDFRGTWQTGATSRGAGVSEFVTTGKGAGYNANVHMSGSVVRFDAKSNFEGPVSGSASGSVLGYSAEADGNIVWNGKGLAADGRLGASADLVEISAKGEVKITPQRVWHSTGCLAQIGFYSLKDLNFSLPAKDIDFISAFPACEEEDGLDDGFGIVIGGGVSGQIGIGAEAGGQLDLGGNERFGAGLGAKATAGGGIGGHFYLGADWSSKKKE